MGNIAHLTPAGCPMGIAPHVWRQALADRIEELSGQLFAFIDALDQMDGDPDLEPNGDEEPSLGWPANGPATLRYQIGDDEDREKDNADFEPSLAALEPQLPLPSYRKDGDPVSWLGGRLSGNHERTGELRQINWAAGSDADGEEDNSDYEPNTDVEPVNCHISGGGSGI